MPIPEQLNLGGLLPTTFPISAYQMVTARPGTPEYEQMMISLHQSINSLALMINYKPSALYLTSEYQSGIQYFSTQTVDPSVNTQPLRGAYRKTVIFGALPNATSTSVPHGITWDASCTLIGLTGYATDPVGLTALSVNYASASGTDNIQLDINATDIVITTASDRTNYTICNIVVEYLRS